VLSMRPFFRLCLFFLFNLFWRCGFTFLFFVSLFSLSLWFGFIGGFSISLSVAKSI